MTWSNWLTFLIVSLAATFSPGPGVLLAISTSLSLGRRRTLYSSAGNAVGVFIVAMIAVTSVGVLLRTSALAFTVLKTMGAAYLIYLGVRQCLSKAKQLQIGLASSATSTSSTSSISSRSGVFSRGLLVALTNPKAILFFTAIFPQFMAANRIDPGRFLLLTLTFVACALISHVCYIFLAARLGNGMLNARVSRLINRASGLLFIGLGCAMLTF